jgi:hypothetical protein
MHGSGVHLALGCVCQRTVLWSGRAACFLSRDDFGGSPVSAGARARLCGVGDTIGGRADTISKQSKRRKRKRPTNARPQGEAGLGAACQSEERASREKEREDEGTEEAWREKRAARAAAKATNPVTAIASEPNADRPPVSNVPDPPAADSSTPQDTSKPVTSSTPDPYVLRLLAALETGFDCASNGEIV